jgi:hypothetical protein
MAPSNETLKWPPYCGDEYPRIMATGPLPQHHAERVMVCTRDVHEDDMPHASEIHNRGWPNEKRHS